MRTMPPMPAAPLLTTTERRTRLARRLHLATEWRATDHVEAARSLVGLHASDPASAVLSSLARCDLDVTSFQSELFESRSTLRMLGMRRTLFVFATEVAPIVQAACTNDIAVVEARKLIALIESAGLAGDGAAWIERVAAATLDRLDTHGPALAAELGAAVPELALQIELASVKPYAGKVGVSTRILFLLAARGQIVRARTRGSWVSGMHWWATTESWLGGPIPARDAVGARADLARAWLASYGPGRLTDLQWWAGWTKTATARALADVGAVEVALDDGTGWVLAGDVEPSAPVEPWAALLPGLDPAVMGWKDRTWTVGELMPAVFDRTGNVGPTVWWDGRVVGSWVHRAPGEIAVALLDDPGAEGRAAIEAQVDAWQRRVPDVAVAPRFPAPADRRLRA